MGNCSTTPNGVEGEHPGTEDAQYHQADNEHRTYAYEENRPQGYVEQPTKPAVYETHPNNPPYGNQPIVPVASENKPTTYDNVPVVVNENKPIVYENKPVVYDNKTVPYENKPLVTHDKPPVSYDNKMPVTYNDHSNNKPVVHDNKPVAYESKPFAYDNKQIVYEFEELKPVTPYENNKPLATENKPPPRFENKPLAYDNRSYVYAFEENKPFGLDSKGSGSYQLNDYESVAPYIVTNGGGGSSSPFSSHRQLHQNGASYAVDYGQRDMNGFSNSNNAAVRSNSIPQGVPAVMGSQGSQQVTPFGSQRRAASPRVHVLLSPTSSPSDNNTRASTYANPNSTLLNSMSGRHPPTPQRALGQSAGRPLKDTGSFYNSGMSMNQSLMMASLQSVHGSRPPTPSLDGSASRSSSIGSFDQPPYGASPLSSSGTTYYTVRPMGKGMGGSGSSFASAPTTAAGMNSPRNTYGSSMPMMSRASTGINPLNDTRQYPPLPQKGKFCLTL